MPAPTPPPGPPGTPPDDKDGRDAARAPIELKVEYRRLNSFFADYTRNISKGGTFIATGKPLAVGTEFLFKLLIPTVTNGLELRGKVAWVVTPEEATAAQAAGMGIRFQYGSEADREGVHRLVERLMVTSLGPTLYRQLLDESVANPAGGGAGGIKAT